MIVSDVDLELLREVTDRRGVGAQRALAALVSGSIAAQDREDVLAALSDELAEKGIENGAVSSYGERLERLCDLIGFDENFPLVLPAQRL